MRIKADPFYRVAVRVADVKTSPLHPIVIGIGNRNAQFLEPLVFGAEVFFGDRERDVVNGAAG